MIAPTVRMPVILPRVSLTPAVWARRLLTATVLAAPLAFGAVQPWVWSAMAVLVAAALVLWAVACVQEREARVVWTPLYIPLGLFAILILTQYLTGRVADAIAAREALIKAVTYAAILFLSLNLWADARSRQWYALGWTATIYTYAIALFAIVQYFSGTDRLYWTVKPRFGGYIFGPYVSHNHYAGLMEMLIPLPLMFVLASRSGMQKMLIMFGAIVALLSVILSGSRGGGTALLVEAVILMAVMALRGVSGDKFIGPAIFLVLMVAAAVWLIPANVVERYTNTVHAPEVSYGIRKNMTEDAMSMLRDHPLIGVGIGGFEAAYPKYQTFASDLLVDFAHNDYAQLMAETGYLGGAIALLALVLFAIRFVRYATKGLTSERALLRLGACFGCIGLLVHSFVDFNFHIPANAALFAFLLGITQVTSNSEFSAKPEIKVLHGKSYR